MVRFMTRFRLVWLTTVVGLLVAFAGSAAAASKPTGFTARYGFQAKASVANSGTVSGSFPIEGEFHITLEQYEDGTPKEISFGLDRLASGVSGVMALDEKGFAGKSFSLLFDRSGRLTDFKPPIPGFDATKLLDAKSGLEVRYRGGKTPSFAEQMRAIPSGTEISFSVASPRAGSGETSEKDKLTANIRFLGVSEDGASAQVEFDIDFDSGGNLGEVKEPSESSGRVTANARIRGKATFELSRGLLSLLGIEGIMSYGASGVTPFELGVNLTITLLEVKELTL